MKRYIYFPCYVITLFSGANLLSGCAIEGRKTASLDVGSEILQLDPVRDDEIRKQLERDMRRLEAAIDSLNEEEIRLSEIQRQNQIELARIKSSIEILESQKVGCVEFASISKELNRILADARQ